MSLFEYGLTPARQSPTGTTMAVFLQMRNELKPDRELLADEVVRRKIFEVFKDARIGFSEITCEAKPYGRSYLVPITHTPDIQRLYYECRQIKDRLGLIAGCVPQ